MNRKPYIINPQFFALFLLAFAIYLVYADTFGFPFIFDDAPNILRNPFIRLQEITWEGIQQAARFGPNKRRWLPNLSFGLNYYFDGYNVFGFHLVNTVVHILTAFSLYLLARLTLGLPELASRFKRPSEIALVAALIWAVHPLQTNAVTYIVQRMTSMATLFFLLSLFCYVKARLHHERLDFKKTVLFGAAALFGVMAMLSKENSGMLPLVIVGYEVFFLDRTSDGTSEKRKVLPLAIGALIIFIIVSFIFLGANPLNKILSYGHRDFTLVERLLSQPRIIFYYLTLLVLPLPARLNLTYDYQFSTGLLSPPQTLLAIIGLGGLVYSIYFMYRRDRLIAFAIFWYLINLLVESSVIPLELIFEHRTYMPSMFLILAATAWGYRLAGRWLNLARVILLGVMVLLSFFTWQRNQIWRSEVSLWTDVVNKSPNLARGYINLGFAYEKLNNHAEAERLLLKSITLDPENSHAHVNLGRVYESQNRFDDALRVLQQGLTTKRPDKANLHNNLAVIYIRKQDYQAAEKEAELAVRANPVMADAYVNLGISRGSLGKHEEAVKFFQKAVDLSPENGEAISNLGVAYDHLNQLDKALDALQRGTAIEHSNVAKTYFYLGSVNLKLGNYEAAIRSSNEAMARNPKLVGALLIIGMVHQEKGSPNRAYQTYQKAIKQEYDVVTALNIMSISYIKNGQPDKAILHLQQALRLQPADPQSHENIGIAYGQQGKAAEAAKFRLLADQLRARQKNKPKSKQ